MATSIINGNINSLPSVFSPSGQATPNAASNPAYSTKFTATQGWYITGGIVVSVALANTRVGPFLLGVLGLALLYQTSLLLQHK